MPRHPRTSNIVAYSTAATRYPKAQDPCSTLAISPRERAGQLSVASAAPAGHSAPMPIPSNVRKTRRNRKVGEKPAMKLHTEYHRMEIISGARRPIRSAIHPAATAPTRRIHIVSDPTSTTSVRSALNCLAIGTSRKRKTVKSNASSVQPSQAATKAYHWSLVGSRHHGPGDDELAA